MWTKASGYPERPELSSTQTTKSDLSAIRATSERRLLQFYVMWMWRVISKSVIMMRLALDDGDCSKEGCLRFEGG
jgi:hypothetical protein